MFGGVNMHKVQIYIKKTLKNRKNYTELGGVVFQLRAQYPLKGGVCKYHCLLVILGDSGPFLLSY